MTPAQSIADKLSEAMANTLWRARRSSFAGKLRVTGPPSTIRGLKNRGLVFGSDNYVTALGEEVRQIRSVRNLLQEQVKP